VAIAPMVAPATKTTLKELAGKLGKSQGEVIDEAVEFYDAHSGGENRIVTSRPVLRKLTKADEAAAARAAGDLLAQRAGRDDIDYSDVESTPTTHVANLTEAHPMPQRPTQTMEEWRAKRRPIPKPKDKPKK